MRKYRVGIIGLRGIASGMALPPGPRAAWMGPKVGPPFRREVTISHAACLDLMDSVELVGYCDLVPELQEEFKEKWGARWPDARAYTDYNTMLAEADLDILTVATGDSRHADMVVDGANAGVKAIMCEKPLATSMEDANRMIRACENHGVPISVGHTHSWDPLCHKVRDMVRDGAIGTLLSMEASHGGPRAMMFRNGTHMLHAIVFFAESDPTHVFGLLEDGFDHWDEYRGDGGKKPENDPGVSGFIKFANGVRAHYDCTKSGVSGTQRFRLQLNGSQGQIFFELYSGSASISTYDGDLQEDVTRTINPLNLASNFQVMGYVAAYEELISIVENGGGEGVGSGQESRKVVQIMTGFLKSHQEGSRLVEVPQ